jgi:hypothetical protein
MSKALFIPRASRTLVGLCEMIHAHQTGGGQTVRWFRLLTDKVRMHLHLQHLPAGTHVVSGSWLPQLCPRRLKCSVFAAVRHLLAVLRSGGRARERVACLAAVGGTHCLALILDSAGRRLRVYDPNGAASTTNPFSSPAVVAGVEASLARRLPHPVAIAPMTRDAVGVQARTTVGYGLCTVFAAYGLAQSLRDPAWRDAECDVRHLTSWCLGFADVMMLDYWETEQYVRRAQERLEKRAIVFEVVNVTEDGSAYMSRGVFKTETGARAWMRSASRHPRHIKRNLVAV